MQDYTGYKNKNASGHYFILDFSFKLIPATAYTSDQCMKI